ncbi:hypothetical protein MIR68_012084 [Amoeboaphelidium protococcarum]|nr:hypothetical protein MIR68_012084 [Amoeboaphelidium protococcarum]
MMSTPVQIVLPMHDLLCGISSTEIGQQLITKQARDGCWESCPLFLKPVASGPALICAKTYWQSRLSVSFGVGFKASGGSRRKLGALPSTILIACSTWSGRAAPATILVINQRVPSMLMGEALPQVRHWWLIQLGAVGASNVWPRRQNESECTSSLMSDAQYSGCNASESLSESPPKPHRHLLKQSLPQERHYDAIYGAGHSDDGQLWAALTVGDFAAKLYYILVDGIGMDGSRFFIYLLPSFNTSGR